MKRQKPHIAVIGATDPINYRSQQGRRIGYLLRDWIDTHEGTLCTGGVEGVGVDVYAGIISYCLRFQKNQETIEDRFFMIVPNFMVVQEQETEKPLIVPYAVPEGYASIARRLSRNIDLEYTGKNMAERRQRLAEIVDMCVVVNGSEGTLDEALQTLKLGKRVMTCQETGGVAADLAKMKRGIQNAWGITLPHQEREYIEIIGNLNSIGMHVERWYKQY